MPLVDRLSFDRCELIGFASALTAYRAGDIDQALVSVKEILSESPNDLYALVLAADCFNHYGKFLESLGLVKAASSASNFSLEFALVEVDQLNILERYSDGLFCLDRVKLSLKSHSDWIWQHIVQLDLLNRCIEASSELTNHINQLKKQEFFYQISSRIFGSAGHHDQALILLNEWNYCLPSRESAKSLADCLFVLGRHDEYVKVIGAASHSYPDDCNLKALSLQAQCDQNSQNISDVIELIHREDDCCNRSPDFAFLAGQLLLAQARFEEGWPLYENRLRIDSNGLYAAILPELDDTQSVEGKNVLLVAEQGVGDVLLFARFIPLLQREADNVVFIVDQRLKPLMQRCLEGVTVVDNLSLAQALAGDNIIVLAIASLGVRYLRASSNISAFKSSSSIVPHPVLSRNWKTRLTDNRIHVGLSLTAGTRQTTYKSQKRSVPIRVVEDALCSVDVDVHDLQHFGSITSSAAAFKCIEHFGVTKDLDQLIALIGCLDILVTSDQTNAFIAGSLGIPTLVIAPPNPHFALMAEGEVTPWFSSITLLRSCSWMGWDELIDPFAQRFQALVSQVVQE